MKALAAVLLALLCGCATTPGDKAQEAAIADIASTGAGLALGAAEMNPLGLLTLPLKYGALEYAKTLPTGEREELQLGTKSVWNGAATNNICVAISIITGGTFALACIPLGIGTAIYQWTPSEKEREFWKHCAIHTQLNPRTVCEFKS